MAKKRLNKLFLGFLIFVGGTLFGIVISVATLMIHNSTTSSKSTTYTDTPTEKIFAQDQTFICPTYVDKLPTDLIEIIRKPSQELKSSDTPNFYNSDVSSQIKKAAQDKKNFCWNGDDNIEYYYTGDAENNPDISLLHYIGETFKWDALKKNLNTFAKYYTLDRQFATNMLHFLWNFQPDFYPKLYQYFEEKGLAPKYMVDIFNSSYTFEEQGYQFLLSLLKNKAIEIAPTPTKALQGISFLFRSSHIDTQPQKLLDFLKIAINSKKLTPQTLLSSQLSEKPAPNNNRLEDYDYMMFEDSYFKPQHTDYYETPPPSLTLAHIYANSPKILEFIAQQGDLGNVKDEQNDPYYFFGFLYFGPVLQKGEPDNTLGGSSLDHTVDSIEDIETPKVPKDLVDYYDKTSFTFKETNDNNENVLLFTSRYGDITMSVIDYFEDKNVLFTQTDNAGNNVLHNCILYDGISKNWDERTIQDILKDKKIKIKEFAVEPCHHRDSFEYLVKKYPALLDQKNLNGSTPRDFLTPEYLEYLKKSVL